MLQEKLVFPDDLVNLWKHAHGEVTLEEEKVESIWKGIKQLVFKDALSRSEKFGLCGVDDLVNDFIVSLISGVCPDVITTSGTLEKCARKFWAEKWNPCGKEINDVVRSGLLGLVKEGRLERSDVGKTIGNKTIFWLAGRNIESVATPEECADVFPKIRRAGSKHRDYSSANKRLLTPTEAQRIVCDLLNLLGGARSVFMEEIMSCALDRTRHVISPFVKRYDEGEDSEPDDSCVEEDEAGVRELDAVQELSSKNFSSRLEQGMRANAEDDDAAGAEDAVHANIGIDDRLFDEERFRRRQLEVISQKTTERIWAGVLKIHGDKVFCLYSLPVFCDPCTKVVMGDIGPTSTVGAQHLKLKNLLQVELAFVIKNPDEYRFGPDNVVRRVRGGLIGRCAENGHIVPL